MIDKLVSVKEFKDYLKLKSKDRDYQMFQRFIYLDRYIDILEQPLKLEMFVPCLDGVPLDEPLDWKNKNSPLYNPDTCPQYQQAEKKVLFEGFYVKDKYLNMIRVYNELIGGITIERVDLVKHLIFNGNPVKLTDNFKQLITK